MVYACIVGTLAVTFLRFCLRSLNTAAARRAINHSAERYSAWLGPSPTLSALHVDARAAFLCSRDNSGVSLSKPSAQSSLHSVTKRLKSFLCSSAGHRNSLYN